MRINRNRTSMIATLSFFVENIYNRYIVLLAQWYTNILPSDDVHPLIGSFLRLLLLCLIRPDLFVIHNCLFIFSKNSFLLLASLKKGKTSVFNALILFRVAFLLKIFYNFCLGRKSRNFSLKFIYSVTIYLLLIIFTKSYGFRSKFQKCFLRRFQRKGLNPFPNKPWFLRVCRVSILKTLWEKEKLLVSKIFLEGVGVHIQFVV